MGTEEHERRGFWRNHVTAWRESALSQRDYCREHGLNEAQFSHWKHRLAKAAKRCRPGVQLLRVKILEDAAPAPVRSETESAVPLAVVLPNGLKLETQGHVEPALLGQIVGVLHRVR